MPETPGRGALAAVQMKRITDEILNEVENFPPELLNWSPGENIWTVIDNLCHIREFIPFWTRQTLRIASGSGDQWGRDHSDKDRLAAVQNTSSYNLEEIASGIREAVRQSADALAKLSDADLAVEAVSKNPRWGLKPASFVIHDLLIQHLEKHLSQIRRNATQFENRPKAQ